MTGVRERDREKETVKQSKSAEVNTSLKKRVEDITNATENCFWGWIVMTGVDSDPKIKNAEE